MAAGISFNSIFATFAALWLAFSIGGLLLEARPALRDAVLQFLNRSIPGLIDTGQGGAIPMDALLEVNILGLSGVVALIGLLVTTLGWLAASRAAIRSIFQLKRPEASVFVQKLKDLVLAFGYGLAVLISAGLTVIGTQAIGLFQPFLGSSAAEIGARIVGLVVMFLFDAVVLASLYRVLARIRIPFPQLIGGVLVGAAGLAVLKILGSQLLVGVARNPLMASFAIVVGLMFWFNLISHVMLIAASWIAESVRPTGTEANTAHPYDTDRC